VYEAKATIMTANLHASHLLTNCDPLVPGPALAMLRIPGPVCVNLKFSSGNFLHDSSEKESTVRKTKPSQQATKHVMN
jgi:hypothetical protein